MIDIFRETTLGDNQLDYYTYQAIESLNLVAPPYCPRTLANVQNTYMEQARGFISRIVKGYSFGDTDNAEKIQQFLKENLYNSFNQKITFQEYIETQLYNYSIHYRFYDEIGVRGKEIVKLFPTSPKYIYPDRKKETFWQIIPNADQAEMLQYPGSEESNVDFRVNHTQYLAYKPTSAAKNQIIEFSGPSSQSDYFPNIPYLKALESVEVNSFIGSYSKKWLTEGTNWKNIIYLSGLDINSLRDKETVDHYKRELNDPAKDGQNIIIPISNRDSKPDISSPSQAKKEDFLNERAENRDEILAANGLNPTILGIKTNDSALTSTSQKEAIQLYVETQAGNLIAKIEKHLDRIFSYIDPAYDTNILLNVISFENALEESTMQTQEIDNELKLVTLGSMDRYNEYRETRGLDVIDEKEWREIQDKYIDAGIEQA